MPESRGWKFACKHSESRRTGLGEVARKHPEIIFNDVIHKIHVNLKDTVTGRTYWDADFTLPEYSVWRVLGKTKLSVDAKPTGGMQQEFRKPCVRGDDPNPHMYDLSIQTRDGFYYDGVTSWGKKEGFKKFGGPRAHIGFEAFRVPKLNADGTENVKEWRRGGKYSRGPVHQDRLLRLIKGEEDPFYNEETGETGSVYYDWITSTAARERNNFEAILNYGPRALHKSAVNIPSEPNVLGEEE